MELFNGIVSLLGILFGCAGTIGAVLAIRQGRSAKIVTIKDETITALQDQVAAIKSKQEDLERQNARMENIISTIQQALRTHGILITIDGEMVSITQVDGVKTSFHRLTKPSSSSSEESAKGEKRG